MVTVGSFTAYIHNHKTPQTQHPEHEKSVTEEVLAKIAGLCHARLLHNLQLLQAAADMPRRCDKACRHALDAYRHVLDV